MKNESNKLLLELELSSLTDAILYSAFPYDDLGYNAFPTVGSIRRQAMKKKNKLEY